jgi:pseudouridine kinase
MGLSPREREIIALLRSQPTLDAAGLARSLGTTKGAVAVALSSLTQKGEIIGRGYLLRGEPSAVVIGGAVWDVKARSSAGLRLRTSNPSTASRTPGGVGRNIAENLARLGGRVQLIAAIGADSAGRELLARTAEAGVDVSQVIFSPHATGSYLAALDSDGELVVGMSDMLATDSLDVVAVARSQDLIEQAAIVVVDGNLPPAVVDWTLAVAAAVDVPVVLEPVSVAKAARLRPVLGEHRPVFAMKPNLDELSALVELPVADDERSIVAAARQLQARGVVNVWVSRAASGGVLVGPDGVLTTSSPLVEVVDVTGAGDAMTAGFVHGLLWGLDLATAARRGQLAAALTVASAQTVRPDLGVAFAQALTQVESQGVRP